MANLAGFYGGTHKGSVFGYSAQYGADFHWGQDIKGHPTGTPIPALAAGVISHTGWQSGHGWWAAVDTQDGWYDTYSHMVSLWNNQGTWLNAGDTVGPLGNTGISFGAHLHTQRTRTPFPWSHGTEVDPWPRIVGIISGTSGGGALVPIDEEEEEEEDMTKNTYIAWMDGTVQRNAILNTGSGFYSEFESNEGGYNTVIARAFDLGGPTAMVSPSHAAVLKESCAATRAGV